jgi:prepilin-type N-terminal cleavage/methylation domain-containing protein
MKKQKKYSKGFTLVELLLVIAIIAILATVLFVSLGGQRERARVTAFKENLRGLVTTFTACTDGKGTLYTGALAGVGSSCSCPGGGCTFGTLGTVPTVPDCQGTGTITISSTSASGDNWNFAGTCTRSSGTCVGACSADGCTFTGTCD